MTVTRISDNCLSAFLPQKWLNSSWKLCCEMWCKQVNIHPRCRSMNILRHHQGAASHGVIWLCTTVEAPLPLMWLDWTKDYNNCFYSMVSLSQTDVAFRWQVTVIYVLGLISLACSGSKCPPSSSLRSKSKMVKFWLWRCPGLHEKEDILDLMEGEVSSNLYCSLLTGK